MTVMTKAVKFFAFALTIWVAGTVAFPAAAWVRPPADSPVIEVDWQNPLSLPRRFRNHCSVDVQRNLPYCSDHCGHGYALFYCSRDSFGCCRAGYGYCDWNGMLRCAP
jgi:hypothetical protein